ncbi:MAG: O-antigen ligase family protein [Bacteroidales bacterium]|nr:O-antigen ligase family protein [Bacteroidales bacterium]
MNTLYKHKKTYLSIAIPCLIFLLLGYWAVEFGIMWYAVLPLAVLFVTLMLQHFHYTLFAVAFLTPFAYFTKFGSFSLSLPTEPMLVLIMFVFLFEMSLQNKVDKRLLKHGISLTIISSLLWLVISSIFSTDLAVSFKHILARLWFIIPCYFMGLVVFEDKKSILWFILLHSLALSIVIVISSVRYALKGFDHEFADYIMVPFYNDHTAYGAAIGLAIPICFYYLFAKKTVYRSIWIRVLFAFICLCLVVGFILSYSRATWLSIVIAAGIFIIIKLNLKKKTFFRLSLLGVVVIALMFPTIKHKMVDNSQDSSGNISEHIQSMSNISTDASNTERLNRWACAWEMTKKKPLFGYGFGTYQFEYGTFQKSKDLTIISTNEGTLGNAHSEYLGPMSETGILGMLIIIAIFVYTTYTGLTFYRKAADKDTANLMLFLTLSLITYYIHGVMNNFLDTDKLSIPFWAMTAMITTLDVFSEKKEAKNKVNINSQKNIKTLN